VNVLTAAENGKETASDREHYAEAKRLGRILLTHDRDFLDRKKFSTRDGTGVVVIDGGGQDLMKLSQIFRFLLLMRRGHDTWTTHIMEIKMDGTIRVRWWEKAEGREFESWYKLGTHYLVEIDGDEG